mmetsp:Transcript_35942/g.65998  ORF Transcript_35942/g.65998 Transcript_35942/m.65998 type:complete len:212 (+) Transcript_35942:62-697(+)
MEETFFFSDISTSPSKGSSAFSSFPHLSTTRRMCPLIIFTIPLRTSSVAPSAVRSFWSATSDSTTVPEASPQVTSQKGLPFSSTSFGASTTLTFKFKPLDSGLMLEIFPYLGFFNGCGGLMISSIFFCIGVASSAVIMVSLGLKDRLLPSSALRGMMWKCGWKTVCPASFPLFDTMLTATQPVAFLTDAATRWRSAMKALASPAGISRKSL